MTHGNETNLTMNERKNLWPLGIVFTFILFVCATVGLVVLACSHKTDLVSTDYYEQEIRFQEHLDRLARAKELGTQVSYEPTTRKIRICLPNEQAGKGVSGSIQLYRPSATGLDRKINFEPDTRGTQFVDAGGLQPGLWKVRVAWSAAKQDYFVEENIRIPAL